MQPLRGFICEDAVLVREHEGAAMRIDITLREDRRRGRARCGCCGRPAPGYDRQPQRRWRFIALWGITVELLHAPRRVNCGECGVHVEAMPWSEGKHQASKAMMIHLAQWARRLSWKETASVFKVSWDMVYRSVQWIVAWGLAHRDLTGIEAIGVDELHRGRGKKSANYITLIYQIDAGCRRLLWVGERRTEACLRAGIGHLDAALQEVKYVCSDMWKPYLKVIASLLPQALNILDRFHIVAHLNAAVDHVRRAEVTRLGGSKESAAGSRLKKMRWNLLRAGKRVRGKARARLKALI